jgi:hypothetical protein
MRRVLRASLPAFSHHFGIQPWQVDDLTYAEIEVYLSALADLNKEG